MAITAETSRMPSTCATAQAKSTSTQTCGAESAGLGQRAEDDERNSAAERKLGEIERELDELALALPAGDDQGDEGADELSEQEGRRGAEQ